MYKPDFKSGDIISFAGEQYVVLENYGTNGLVKENYDGGDIIKFKWEFDGERCQLVSR